MKETIKVLFASGSEDLIPTAIEHMRALLPELPLVVVSEFPPENVRWIPFPLSHSFSENLALCRWHFRDKNVRISAVILQPRMPYWPMRLIAFLIAPLHFLAFNEGFGHFMLRPQSAFTILRHLLWRTRNLFVWEFSPGGATYTFFWRLAHPSALRRPMLARLANLAARFRRAPQPHSPLAVSAVSRPRGVSVVVPSRNGRDLLATLLPELVRQVEAAGGEIIVVDNGSDDETASFLGQTFPTVSVDQHDSALSFAGAVNVGIGRARFSHICLLNNDMVIAPGFVAALLGAFDHVPDLFCATAQIFFPDGARREETGKAIMPFRPDRQAEDFPVRCDLPRAGEDLSYVLYGSGGCSLFDAAKLLALGGMDEIYQPAYVEDLDLGFRGWRQGWPSVFVAAAQVVHKHRTTTSRHYSQEFLDRVLEVNYLRFLARNVADRELFLRLWSEAVARLNLLAAKAAPNAAAQAALAQAWRIPREVKQLSAPLLSEDHILAIGSGAVAVTPGQAARNRPVVVIVTPYLPFPLAHGGAVRMYNLMRRAARDFDQVLLSFESGDGAVPAELRDICCEVILVKRSGSHLLPSTDRPSVVEEFDSTAFHAALRETVRKWKPKIAQLEFTQMAQYAPDCSPAKTILVEHDITLDLYQQLLAQSDDWEMQRQLQRWIPFETTAWRQVDRVVTMSEKDRALTVREGVPESKANCLANGVDLQRFQPSPQSCDPRRLLFIGSFAHLPNVLAVEFFLREVWPHLSEATLHIIAGSNHRYFLDRYQDRATLNLDQPGLLVEDFVSDVRPAYERAAVVVAPLLASAGTNIKIMEAMAMGKAIVSTPAGINGLDLDAGKDVLVESTGLGMAQAIAALLENPAQRQAIERQARLTVESKFDWDVIARQQEQLYRELI